MKFIIIAIISPPCKQRSYIRVLWSNNASSSPSNMGSTNSDWQTIVAAKQKKSQSLIPEAWRLPESITKTLQYPLEEHANRLLDLDIPKRSGILSARELEITEANTVADLLSKLASGTYTALEVTTAFCKRAAIAQQLVSTKATTELRDPPARTPH